MTLNIEQLYFDSEDHNLVDTLARSDIDKFSTQVNLIENSDWELGTDYWRIWGNNPNYPEPEIREIVEDENGTKWFHLKTPANTRYQGFQQQASRYGLTRKLKKNTNYLITVRAYGKKEGTSLAVAIHFSKNNTRLGQWFETKIINTQETVYCWTVKTPDIECNNFNFMIGQWSMTKKEEELWVTDISMKEFPLELSNIIKEYPQLKEDISSTSIIKSDTGYLSFGNGIEDTSLKSLKIKIPLIGPEGTPSPDAEPLVFTSWSKDFTFSHKGKNLIDGTTEGPTEGDSLIWSKNKNGAIFASGIANNNSIYYLSKDGFILPPGKYILTDTGDHVQGHLWYSLNNETSVQVENGESIFEINEAQTIKIWCSLPSGTDATGEIFIPMLRLDYIDNTYEPYKQGENYHINFPSDEIDEVYEGYVDVVKGKLVITKYLHTINPDRFGGANAEAIQDVVRGYIYNLPSSIPWSSGKNAEAICNYFPKVEANYNANVQGFYFYSDKGVYFKISKQILRDLYPDLSLSEGFIQYFRDHEVKIVYSLETPKEYPITATDIKAYGGVNTFLSEENSFEVEYRTDKSTNWIYVNPNSLVRSNGEFLLDAGDGINFTNNDLQYFIRYTNNSKETKIFNWRNADIPFICPEDGLYTIIIKRKSQLIDLNLLEKVENAVTIYRNKSIYTNLFNNHKTYTIGHSSGGNARDSNLETPDNSIAGLKDCVKRGIWAVSCDIRWTSDGEWVLMHDATIDNTTTGTGYVYNQTLAQLKNSNIKLKKGIKRDSEDIKDYYISEEGIPTLKEWLLEARRLGIYTSVQIENTSIDSVSIPIPTEYIENLVHLIEDLQMEKQVFLCGFKEIVPYLIQIKQLNRNISTSFLLRSWPLFTDGQPHVDIARLAVYGNTWISFQQDDEQRTTRASRELLSQYQKMRIPCGVWTSYPSSKNATIEILPYGFDYYSTEVEDDVNNYLETKKEKPKDLTSKEIVIPGFMNRTTGAYEEMSSTGTNEMMTDFIEIKPSTVYTFFTWVTVLESTGYGYWHRVAWFDQNKNFICSAQITSGSYKQRKSYISPSNAQYMQFAFRSYQDGVCSIYEGNIEEAEKPDWNVGENIHPLDIYNIKSIAHRGYSYQAPENTIPAFVEAKQRGFNFVECDLGFTSDNICVLLHDYTINRTARNSDGTTYAEEDVQVNTLTYEELEELDFGIWKNSRYQGTKIPTLDDFLLTCKQLHLYPYIELKNSGFTRENIVHILQRIQAYNMIKETTITSFNVEMLNYTKLICPSIRLGYLTDQNNVNWDKFLRYCQIWQTKENAVVLIARKNTVLQRLNDNYYVNGWRNLVDNGIPVEVWTISSNENDSVFTNEIGITGFISDKKTYEDAIENQKQWSKKAITYSTESSYTLTEDEFVDFGVKQNLTVMTPLRGEYRFAFVSTNPATNLTLYGVQMPEDFEINSYRRYEINIFNGYGVAQEWPLIITVEEETSEQALS